MKDRDIIEQLNNLKSIKPSKDWSSSDRENLINHIDASIETYQTNESNKSYKTYWVHNWETIKDRLSSAGRHAAWASAGTMALVLGLIGGVFMAQDSTPGSLLYPVKLASEDVHKMVSTNRVALEASLATERVEEAEKLATTNLPEDDAARVSEKLEEYRNNIEEAKTSGDEEQLENATREAEENSRSLTSLISNAEARKEFRANVEDRLAECEDEKLSVEIETLLEEGGILALVNAHELSIRCTTPAPDGNEDGSSEVKEGEGSVEGETPVNS